MKIIFILPNLVTGGVSSVVKNLMDELCIRFNYEITLITLFEEESKDISSSYSTLSLDITSSPFSWFVGLRRLNAIINDLQPDIVHSHTLYPHYISCFLSFFYKKEYKLICSEHGTYLGPLKFYKRMNFFRIISGNADLITNVSLTSSKSYIDQGIVCVTKGVETVYNGVNLNLFRFSLRGRNEIREGLNIGFEEKVIGFVGRLSPEKNLMNLLNAIKDLDVKVVIVGDGPEHHNLEKFIIDNNISDRVHVVGGKSNILDYYSAFDVLVLSSNTEGLPTVIIEAIACDCLVVTTNCGGVKEILPVDYPFISPICDHISLKKNIMDTLELSNSESLELKRQCSVLVHNRFSLDLATQHWFEIYDRLSKY